MDAERHEDVLSFGDLLRRHRLAAGLTQEELAERATLSARGISDLERGARTRPQRETLDLLVQALGLVDADRTALLSAARAPRGSLEAVTGAGSARRSPLPIPPDLLVGRSVEIAAITALLQEPAVRLVTLTGVGGVGKTRLALEVARFMQPVFPDGVWFVDLSPVANPTDVSTTIATALGLRESEPETLRDALWERVASRQLLLILDNFEHLLAAAPLVSDLLHHGPAIKVISTSREALRLRGEREVAVSPLALPTDGARMAPGALADVPAVALFVDRARAVSADFALTVDNAAAVAQITRRLDGIPLAIELAAARINLLPPPVLLDQLGARFALLTSGARDASARHRTLRDTIGWSYGLLASDEQQLFRRLSVFAGGWTLDAAAAVTKLDDLDVLAGMGSLVDKNLIRQSPSTGATVRYGMLETVREFAREQLASHGETEALRAAHAACYRGLGYSAFAEYLVSPHAAWKRLTPETDNLRLALAWAAETHEIETGLWLAHALAVYARGHGSLSEARGWVDHFIDAHSGEPSIPLARALNDAGRLALMQNDLSAAERASECLSTIESTLTDDIASECSRVLRLLIALQRGDLADAQRLADEGLATTQNTDPELFLRSVAFESAALVAYERGDLNRAALLNWEYLAWLPADFDSGVVGGILASLGHIARRQGRDRQAARHWTEALERLRGQEEETWSIGLAIGAGLMAEQLDQPALGVKLIAAATVARRQTGLVHFPSEMTEEAQLLESARKALGEEQFSESWKAGSEAALETMMGEAYEVFSRFSLTGDSSCEANPAELSNL